MAGTRLSGLSLAATATSGEVVLVEVVERGKGVGIDEVIRHEILLPDAARG
jgi:hypothetical protein